MVEKILEFVGKCFIGEEGYEDGEEWGGMGEFRWGKWEGKVMWEVDW